MNRKMTILLGCLVAVSLMLATACGGGKPQTRELHVYNWSAYIDPQIYKDFEAEFGVRVVEDTFASNEELLAKLQAGARGYDVIVPSDYMVEVMIRQGLLQELNHQNLPNLGNIDSQFADPPYDPGMRHCIPYQWGTTGIGYNAEAFPEPPDSWAYFFDPQRTAPYAGKFTMLNDAREVIGAALKYLGYSLNTTNPDELAAARDLLIRQKDWLYAYDSEQYRSLLPAGEIVMAQGFSGDFFMVAEEDPRIRYVIPREGTTVWTDNLCIPVGAPNKEMAEVFINYLLRPDVGARISNYTRYASPNLLAKAYIDPELLEDPAVYPPLEVRARLEWVEDLGEAAALYDRIWTEIRAAAP